MLGDPGELPEIQGVRFARCVELLVAVLGRVRVLFLAVLLGPSVLLRKPFRELCRSDLDPATVRTNAHLPVTLHEAVEVIRLEEVVLPPFEHVHRHARIENQHYPLMDMLVTISVGRRMRRRADLLDDLRVRGPSSSVVLMMKTTGRQYGDRNQGSKRA